MAKMQAGDSPETPIKIYQTARSHIPEDSYLQYRFLIWGPFTFTPKLVLGVSYEAVLNFFQTTQPYIPEDRTSL